MLEYARYFKNEFSELTGASSPQTSPGLHFCGVNDRVKFKHCYSQILNGIAHSCAYGLYTHCPWLWICLTSKYLAILNSECLLLEKVWLHLWAFGLSKLRGILRKEAVYHKIKITYNNITYKETSFSSLALLHKPLIWALNFCAPKIDKIMSNLLWNSPRKLLITFPNIWKMVYKHYSIY